MKTTGDDGSGVEDPRPEDPAEESDEEGTGFDKELSDGVQELGGIEGQRLEQEKIDTQTYKDMAVLKRRFAKCFIFALILWPFILLVMLVGYGLVFLSNDTPPTEIFIALLTAASVNFLFLAGIIFTREQRLSKPSKK